MWWFRYRRVSRPQVAEKPHQINLRQAARQLKRACTANNAPQARDSLLQWAGALPVGVKFSHLNQLAAYFGEPLKSQIDSLNESLYAAGKQNWQGDGLWQACELIMRDTQPRTETHEQSLPALNP